MALHEAPSLRASRWTPKVAALLVVAWAVAPLPAEPVLEAPQWAFPGFTNPPATGAKPDDVTRLRVSDSDVTFTQAQLVDMFIAPDWFPDRHPPMPDGVGSGRRPDTPACAFCHLPDGTGRPENAALAGLSADYIRAQVADMRSGLRRSASSTPYRPSQLMQQVAATATEAEVDAAASYFSGLPMRRKVEVVESTRVPVTEQMRFIYVAVAHAGDEPLGNRLIEMPADPARHELRDPNAAYRAYVPIGSLERGRMLATAGDPQRGAIACVTCHGPLLRGTGVIPPLAGRSPSYLLRQLLAFKSGARASPTGAAMQPVIAHLGLDDMIAVVAYAATLDP